LIGQDANRIIDGIETAFKKINRGDRRGNVILVWTPIMTLTTHVSTRRSQRVSRAMPVLVCGESSQQKPFREVAATIAFNAHGVLLVLNEKVLVGQKLLLTNPATQVVQEGRVVYFTTSRGGSMHIGIEFIRPAPAFWPIESPPEDWKAIDGHGGLFS
jgi:hypothetical protein